MNNIPIDFPLAVGTFWATLSISAFIFIQLSTNSFGERNKVAVQWRVKEHFCG